MQTPKELGFSMPAEWAEHRRCWMMWPCRREVWPDFEATLRGYAAVAHAIREFEPVTMATPPEDAARARSMLGGDIEVIEVPLDDSWSRDAGPVFLKTGDGETAGVNFCFNAWGGKYDPFHRDNAFSSFVLETAGARQFYSSLTAEGGGISVDGEGTLLTTESCFPNRNRNPGWTRDAIELELCEMLGVTKVIWLPGDEEETETDGHVDGIAVFAEPGVVIVGSADQPNDPYREAKQDNVDALRGQTDARGRPIRLIPIPAALDAIGGNERFCAEYVNFYIANGGIVMPEYDLPTDAEAREVLEEAFPGRRILGVPVRDIAIGGGGIHCITQQEPV